MDEPERIVEPMREFTFVIGDGDVEGVCIGVELALRIMFVRQKVILRMAPKFIHSKSDRPEGVEDDSKLEYHLELMSLGERPKNPGQMTPDERVAMVDSFNKAGNDFFKAGDLEKAVKSYNKALEYVRYVSAAKPLGEAEEAPAEEEAESKAQLTAAKIRCGNNLAVALVRLERLSQAEDMCDMVLKMDQSNVKSLYQKGKLVARRRDYEDAKIFFEKADAIEPGNNAIERELATVELVLKEKEARVKGMYNKMLGTPKPQSKVEVVKNEAAAVKKRNPDEMEIEEVIEDDVGEGDDADLKATAAQAKEEKDRLFSEIGINDTKKGKKKKRNNKEFAILMCTVVTMLLVICWAIWPRNSELGPTPSTEL